MSIRYDITIEQKATFLQVFYWYDSTNTVPINLTGFTGTCRLASKSESNVLTTVLDCTVTIDPLVGKIIVSATPTQTAALVAPNQLVYDLLISSAGGTTKYRIVEGFANVTLGVSP